MERIDPPTHEFIENTIPSIQAAVEAGADIIELDIKLTTDGEIVVFHDETLDCRTDGTGKTHHQNLAYLRGLDIGYGYTSDGGKTYPFRGQFIVSTVKRLKARLIAIILRRQMPSALNWLDRIELWLPS